MSSGNSESSSSSSTSTENYDQRVGADQGAVALGPNASLQINDQFSENVQKAFSDLISLAEGAGDLVIQSNQNLESTSRAALDANQKAMQAAIDANQKAMQAALDKIDTSGQRATDISKSTLDAVTQQLSRQQAGSSTIYTDIFPYVAAVIIGLVAILIFYKAKAR